MDTTARVTSKGQGHDPQSVRDALDVHAGGEVIFHVEHSRAVVAKTPDFLALAGTVAVPGKRGTSWDEVLRGTQTERARRGHRASVSTSTCSSGT